MQSFGKAFLAMSLEVEGVFQTAAMRLKRTVGLMPAFWCLFFFKKKDVWAWIFIVRLSEGMNARRFCVRFALLFWKKKTPFCPASSPQPSAGQPPIAPSHTSHHLPPPWQIGNLSGGQKARVAFAGISVSLPHLLRVFFFGCRGGWVGRWV